MSGINREEKHKLENKMRLSAIDLKKIITHFENSKNVEMNNIAQKLKNRLDILFIELEKLLHPKDIEEFLDVR